MDKNNLIELTYVEWRAWLKALPSSLRTHKHVPQNFERLFQAWKQAGASFDDVYETYLPKAIKDHLPGSALARASYRKLKETLGSRLDKTEKEYVEEWTSGIEAKATELFFEFFPATTLDKDDEPKVFGNMSAAEYRAQRKYADQFPTLDTRELVKQWKKQQDNLSVDDMIENVLGDKDEE